MAFFGPREIAAALRLLVRGELARYHTSGLSEVAKFERELAQFMGVDYALGVNSGTSALICALVGAGIGPGDEVLVPAYTWVSSAAAPLAVGAVPVLVEVDRSLTIDPVDIRRKITPHTKAIIPVHMLNLVCDMDAIMAIAREHKLIVIEDACQAVGVTYRGRRVGSIGHIGCFSFQQHKNIDSGEGGALMTNDERVYSRACMYHDVGSYTRKERLKTDEPLFVGMNFRMPELAAALLRPQLRKLDDQLARRHAQRQAVIDRLSRLTPSPHHDPDAAAGVTFYFDDPDGARAFGNGPGVNLLINTGRHVYTNWQSVLAMRSAHPKLNPYNWARKGAEPRADSCPQTLDILGRTCNVKLLPEVPTLAYRAAVELMARHADRVPRAPRRDPATTVDGDGDGAERAPRRAGGAE
jgi:dTDP-4-amino-4,6-dideoxygalactose transaminase